MASLSWDYLYEAQLLELPPLLLLPAYMLRDRIGLSSSVSLGDWDCIRGLPSLVPLWDWDWPRLPNG